ncbi:MAG: hypothetical protein IKQ85_03275 [Bacteroidaceae bacterium]|nr:hypothetical protein [Bacteroidaceae bacterium]
MPHCIGTCAAIPNEQIFVQTEETILAEPALKLRPRSTAHHTIVYHNKAYVL